eukprot:gnl/Trimastix_PCT/3270.p1 GENE.gnl/Trimastix_PCT/3270~~gnl/Trimastix_PCT/3270.p1  ORF type:complete len:386 (+),score=39.46 gnl/Trimastix_PCT/3270:670-1827(+)
MSSALRRWRANHAARTRCAWAKRSARSSRPTNLSGSCRPSRATRCKELGSTRLPWTCWTSSGGLGRFPCAHTAARMIASDTCQSVASCPECALLGLDAFKATLAGLQYSQPPIGLPLPRDLLLAIFACLSWRDRLRLAFVSKEFRSLALDDRSWRHCFHEAFGEESSREPHSLPPWRQYLVRFKSKIRHGTWLFIQKKEGLWVLCREGPKGIVLFFPHEGVIRLPGKDMGRCAYLAMSSTNGRKMCMGDSGRAYMCPDLPVIQLPSPEQCASYRDYPGASFPAFQTAHYRFFFRAARGESDDTRCIAMPVHPEAYPCLAVAFWDGSNGWVDLEMHSEASRGEHEAESHHTQYSYNLDLVEGFFEKGAGDAEVDLDRFDEETLRQG